MNYVYGNIGATEIPTTDALYKRLLDELEKAIDTDKYASSNVIAFDLHVAVVRWRLW